MRTSSAQSVLAAVALGSNLGDRAAQIAAALERLRRLPGTTVRAASDPIETEPVGPVSQPNFLNAAALLETGLGPRALLDALLAVERDLGRTRSPGARWGPRAIDLDLLVFGDRVIHEPGLVIPHPRLHERAFVLEPLARIAPDLMVPGVGRTVRALLDALPRPAGARPS